MKTSFNLSRIGIVSLFHNDGPNFAAREFDVASLIVTNSSKLLSDFFSFTAYSTILYMELYLNERYSPDVPIFENSVRNFLHRHMVLILVNFSNASFKLIIQFFSFMAFLFVSSARLIEGFVPISNTADQDIATNAYIVCFSQFYKCFRLKLTAEFFSFGADSTIFII